MTSLFPMFLKLEGRQVLVVGAGKVGEPKIGGLLETGARGLDRDTQKELLLRHIAESEPAGAPLGELQEV